MKIYGVFFKDTENPWLHDVPRLQYVSGCDWAQGHFHLLHAHEEAAEILLICSGQGVYSLDHNRYEVSAGDIVLCNRGAAHEEFVEKDSGYQTLCISVCNLNLPGLPAGHFLARGQSPVLKEPDGFEELKRLFELILKSVRSQKPYFREECQGMMLAGLAIIRRMLAERAGEMPPAQGDPLCVRVEEYIAAHYAEELTLERLGREFHISPYHLAHVFKQQTGYTLKQYLLRLRIGQSQICLMYTEDSVAEIAGQVGFEEAAHFSKLFSKYIGMSPSAYREYRRKE